MFQTKVGKKIENTLFVQHLLFENRAFYEVMWRNVVGRGRPQMTIWRMRIACWVTKATDTRTQVV